MDRRNFIAASGAAALAASLPAKVLAQASSGDAALNALFERIFQRAVARSPELASQLGLDKGDNAPLKRRLSPRTAEERQRQLAEVRQALAQLRAVDRSSLSPASTPSPRRSTRTAHCSRRRQRAASSRRPGRST